MQRPALIVHGGAGSVTTELGAAYIEGCEGAAHIGWALLERGEGAVDAVTAAVVDLENNPTFNAGLGSVLTSAGTVETDASIMDGTALTAGACGAVSGVKNPVLLARAVLEDGKNVLLVGKGAEAFASERGIVMWKPGDLITERQRTRWQRREPEAGGLGTVGAAAVDAAGHLAAATSTGGLFNKRPGRVGDSAVIGAGAYADDRLGAACATGNGEAILRVALAKTAVDLLRQGRDPMVSAQAAIALLADRTRATAGLIVVDRFGRVGYARNSSCMPVAHWDGQRGKILSAC